MSSQVIKITGVVLAGGTSKRFGRDKRLAECGGQSLLAHSYETLAEVAEDVFISVERGFKTTAMEDFRLMTDGRIVESHVIEDEVGERGPLGGLASVMKTLDEEWILVLATDLPRMTPGSLQRLISEARPGRLAVVAVDSENVWQPLAGCYNRRLLPYIEEVLRGQQLGVRRLLERISKESGGDCIVKISIPDHDLLNINYPEDLERLLF